MAKRYTVVSVIKRNLLMPRELVATRQTENGKEYLCPLDSWVKGQVWNGTGFPQYVCPHCDTTLDDDPCDAIAYENDIRTSDD
jgi:hypothetical protein